MITVSFTEGGPVTLGPAQAKALGGRIKALRKAGIADEEIAAKLGIARGAVGILVRSLGIGAAPAKAGELTKARPGALAAKAGELTKARPGALAAKAGELTKARPGAPPAKAGELTKARHGAPPAKANAASARSNGAAGKAEANAAPPPRAAGEGRRFKIGAPGRAAEPDMIGGLKKIEPLTGVKASAPKGRRPYLAEIPLAQLVVETDYQREIGRVGAATIRRIVRDFRWARFGPLIVAPLGDNRFAIIDGQHRATALATLGIASAPSIVHEIDKAARADAYHAINTCVTAMTTQAKFYAGAAAGDEDALAVRAVCDGLGISILKYSAAASQMKGRQCCAAGALLKVQRRHGAAILKAALTALATRRDYAAGDLKSASIEGLAAVLTGGVGLPSHPEDIAAALEGFDLDGEHAAARERARRTGGKTPDIFAAALATHLKARLGNPKRRADGR